MKKHKSFLITGATSGVGYALTKRLLKEGHEVWATGRDLDVLWELQNEGAHTIPADLTEKGGIQFVMNQIDAPDIVIFSAGVGTFQYAHELSSETTSRTMDINVVAPIKLTKRLLPNMMARKSGHLIYLGSQAGKVATPKASVYAASKHALLGYANALRMEVAPFGIHVTTINPGPIDTPFLDLADETGNYRKSLSKHLLTVETVVDSVMQSIEKPVREVNLPWYMGITSKLHALAPTLVERLGRNFFMKK
ncbi:SDR family NAD(P)-dependent oxidoreductase [Sporosarcina sp. Marseille-Q4063]|uniref:SDR family NAD(P)-dependent oxidoreductase n=1 Tax=Sporosarcina sp. Marseille-Q4063 TaxID=2810514 RepID=UPI001BB09AE2|nr:SDR family NAD(P)-dependent oxidoreductase [Sporosarcina sp. Marseille-Q4063]QUW22313.1 SDR family NAD(P)-dependent oxidoreductase [Sporosarcina sp. Marseille-Q4063]